MEKCHADPKVFCQEIRKKLDLLTDSDIDTPINIMETWWNHRLYEVHMSNSLQTGKVREAQRLSKTKQKKLKRLQEEKEKKLLLFKSSSSPFFSTIGSFSDNCEKNFCANLFRKYKISDGAHSLLQSSGTISQAETMKEKRRRAVQLSKAGLEVPEDISPVKKKGKWNGESDNAATMELDFGQNCTETGSHDNGLMAVECTEVGDNAATMDADKCMPEEQKSSPLVSCSQYKVHNTKAEDHSTDGSNVYGQNLNVPAENAIKKSASTPIVEHVSRPNEVEKKRKDLPIIMMEQEIMEAIHEHSVVILCGETGCGKTTQVPQFLYEAGYGSRNYSERKGMIGVTQPRRVAVLATAKRVSFELGLRLGKEVGFQVRHDKMIGDSCSIKFMTDGILLREIQSDFLLKQYSVIILDEAHERSLNTDILVGMLSRIIRLRQKLYAEQQEKIISGARISPENMITQLKLVLMSATLRVEDFVSDRKLFHEVPPLLEVPVRQFPVTIHFSKRTQQDYLGQAYKKIMSIHRRLPSGGILVFVTGQREVEFLCKKLRKASRQLAENNYKKKVDSSITPSSEVDLDIREAFEVRSSSPDQQTDRFSFYDEDEGNLEMDSYSSDSGTESELEADMEEVPEKNGLVLDFLKDADGLSSLKASFEALAGNLSNQTSKEKTDVPDSLTLEAQAEVAAPSVSPLYVLPLYAMLPASAQLQVFEDVPEGERLVVVATNVAETSLTIPGIRYVVDTGKEKVKNYNYASGMATYEVQWISKASAAQRAGRAGRTGPGHCYRLYSSAAYSKDDIFSEFSCPEISKIPVDGVVLLMKSMYIDKVANFPFPTPPETAALVEAEHCLRALEALDTQGRLTPMGKAMAQYPMSPRHSRMLLTVIKILSHQQDYARANFILAYAVASAAALSCPNPFIMQFGGSSTAADDIDLENHDEENLQNQQEKQRKKKAKSTMKEARERFCNPSSDALTVAYALQLFELAENSLEFCQSNSLHLKTMEAMSKLRKQLLQMIFHQSKFSKEFGWHLGSAEDVEHTWRVNSSKQPLRINEEELLGQAICAGWADRVAKRVRRVSESSDKDHKTHAVEYQSSALNDTIYLNRSSSVSRMAPDFVVYTELLQTKRPYMHGVTSVKSVWMAKNASSLCSFSAPLADPKPYYEPLSDQVLCWVSPTFGRHNWQLPLHSIPIKDDDLRLCVFACALLEGNVLPCMKSAQRFLSIPPLSILRPDALGQRRVGDLLNGLKIGRRKIDSRTKLREAWNKNPQFLQLEIKHWFQDAFHHRFAGFWEQMHREVLLEGNELFPKMSKDKKKAK